MQNFSQI